jgi:hypothetical protein
MRLWPSLLTVLAATAATLILGAVAVAVGNSDAPKYDADGRLIPPAAYREWVFLSSGVDMSYSDGAAMADAHEFDNVFAPPAAYAAFKRTGVWPNQTMLVLENRVAKSKGSINRQGLFQTGEVMGLEAHVKDTARFKGGWAFFAMQGDARLNRFRTRRNVTAAIRLMAPRTRPSCSFIRHYFRSRRDWGSLTPPT